MALFTVSRVHTKFISTALREASVNPEIRARYRTIFKKDMLVIRVVSRNIGTHHERGIRRLAFNRKHILPRKEEGDFTAAITAAPSTPVEDPVVVAIVAALSDHISQQIIVDQVPVVPPSLTNKQKRLAIRGTFKF